MHFYQELSDSSSLKVVLFACSRRSSFARPKAEPRKGHPRHLTLRVPCASRNCREFKNSLRSDSSNSFFDKYCDARLRVDGRNRLKCIIFDDEWFQKKNGSGLEMGQILVERPISRPDFNMEKKWFLSIISNMVKLCNSQGIIENLAYFQRQHSFWRHR